MSCYTRLLATRDRNAPKHSTALDHLAERVRTAATPELRAVRLAAYAMKAISDAHGHALIAGTTLAANDLA